MRISNFGEEHGKRTKVYNFRDMHLDDLAL